MKLKLGVTYDVTVKEIIPCGAVVEMSDGSTELIHISNISERYVRRVDDFVREGDRVQATAIVGKAHPEELSLKDFTKNIVLPYHLREKKKQ